MSALVLITVLCVPAFALSDDEFLEMKEDPEFAEADRKLNTAYNNAKKSMTKAQFEHLKELQLDWIESWRDEEAERLIDEGHSRLSAYTEVTKSRAENLVYIIDLIKYEGDYYNKKGVHLEVTWQNPLKAILFAEFSYRGKSWLGEGDEEFRGINEFNETTAEIEFVDFNTVRVKADDAFKNAVGFNASGTYTRKN
jgi:hypothetical protein